MIVVILVWQLVTINKLIYKQKQLKQSLNTVLQESREMMRTLKTLQTLQLNHNRERETTRTRQEENGEVQAKKQEVKTTIVENAEKHFEGDDRKVKEQDKGDAFLPKIDKENDETCEKVVSDDEKDDVQETIRDLVIERMMKDGMNLQMEDEKWKNDVQVVTAAVQQNCESLQFASERLRNDEQIILPMVNRKTAKILKFIGQELNRDRQFIMKCINQYAWSLEHLSYEWKDAKDVVLAAVNKSCGACLAFASDRLRNDREFVMLCITINAMSLQFLGDKLKHDRDFILSAMKVNGSALDHVPHFQNDKMVVMNAVTQNGNALYYASDDLKNDEQVVMTAVKNYSLALIYASDSLRHNVEFVLKCIEEKGAPFLGAGFSGERAVPDKLNAVPDKLKDDFDFMVRAVKLDRNCIQYASERLKNDEQFKQIVSQD